MTANQDETTAVTDLTFSTAYARLLGSQKPSKGAAVYSRYVNRPLGRVFAAFLAPRGFTPNAVTGMSALATFSGIALIALVPPTLALSVVVVLLLVLGYALDSADGQVSRLRGGGSLAGEWLDHVVDAIKVCSLHLAVLVSWFRFTDLADGWMLVPLGFSIAATAIFFGLVLTDLLRRLHRGSSSMILERKGHTSFLYSLAVAPFDYGVFALTFVILWWTPGFVAVYTLLFVANVLVLPVVLTRWFREMRGLGRA